MHAADPATITVAVDRDSVAMGDDVVSHREEWTLPAAATAVDVLLAVFERHFLARVAGPVGWVMELGERTWVRRTLPDGTETIAHEGAVREVLLLHVGTPDDPTDVRVSVLDGWAVRQPLREVIPPDGPQVVRFRYCTHACSRSLGELVEFGTATGARPTTVRRAED